MKVWTRYWPLICAMAIFWPLLAYLYHGCVSRTGGYFVYTLDDPYIHMAMAKNFALHNVWGVTPYEYSSATSSPLWTLLLGVMYKIFGVRDTLALWLSYLFASLILVEMNRFLTRNKVPPPAIFALLLSVVFLVPLPQIVFDGMEHCLQVYLVVAFLAALQVFWETKRGLLWLAVLTAISTAVRYDSLFITTPLCLLFALRRQWQPIAALVVASLIPIVLYGAISVHYGSLWLPNSVLMKAVVGHPILSEDFLMVIYTHALTAPQLYGLILCVAVLMTIRWLEKRPQERGIGQFFSLLFLMTALLHLRFVPFYSAQWNCRYQAYLMTMGMVAMTLNWFEYRAAQRSVTAEIAPPDPKRALAFSGMLFLLMGTLMANLLLYYVIKEMNYWVFLFGPTVTAVTLYFALMDPKAGKAAARTTGIVIGMAGIFGLIAGLVAAFAKSEILQFLLILPGIAIAAAILYYTASVADQAAPRARNLRRLSLGVVVLLSLPLIGYQGRKNIIYIAPSSYNIYEFHIQMGRFLHQFYPNAGVIVNDLGVVTYMTDIHCVDLWALGSVDVLKHYMKTNDVSGKGLRPLLDNSHCQIAILADFLLGEDAPPTWVGVGEWEIHDDVVGSPERFIFYATSAGDAPALEAHLREYAPNVPPTVTQSGPYTQEK